MTVESRLDVETQHPKWQGVAKFTCDRQTNCIEKDLLIKAAIAKLAEVAKREIDWPKNSCWTATIVKELGPGGAEGGPDTIWTTVAAKIIRIHVDQQPFTTWDKLFASLVWPSD